MALPLQQAKNWLLRREKTVLWTAIFAYFVILSAVCLWKYAIFAYDGIDLAYFNQVFWNTLHARFFTQSIHPHSSLGDHAELIIPVLALLYALLPRPEGLLILQTAALGLAAWPLYLIARERLTRSHRAERSITPLLIALVWLMSPIVQNINLFEFHVLPFALLPLFFSLYAYDRGKKIPFLLFAFAALLIREDVALVIAAVGILAWIEKRSPWWRFAPLGLGIAWFMGAMSLIRHFAPAGGYKYMVYYRWLGDSCAAKAAHAVLDPLRVLSHVLTLANLEMLIGFGLPLLFLPFVRPRRLVLAVGPLLQIILGAPGGGELVLQTHYATLFLPAVFLAGLDGLVDLGFRTRPTMGLRPAETSAFLKLMLLMAALYSMIVLGPLPSAATLALKGEGVDDARLANRMLEKISAGAPVAASYALLPRLSSRERLTSLHYVFLGVNQFGQGSYAVPEDIRFVALDTDDLRTYRAQFLRTAWAEPYYDGGYDRLRRLGGERSFNEGRYQLYAQDAAPTPSVVQMREVPVQHFKDGNVLDAAGVAATDDMLIVSARWSPRRQDDAGLVIGIRVRDERGRTVQDREFPWGNGLREGQAMEFRMPLIEAPGMYFPSITLKEEKTALTLDGIRSTERTVLESEDLGGATLPPFEVKR